MNNNMIYIIPRPQMGQTAPAPQLQAQPILYRQQFQPQFQPQIPGQTGTITVELPIGPAPGPEEKTEMEQLFRRTPKADLVGAYKMATKHIDEVQRRNGQLYAMVVSKDKFIKTLGDKEAYFRTELGTLQLNHAALERELHWYRSGMETIPKRIHEEVLEQNKIIAGNNHLLCQQNEQLQMEVEQAKVAGGSLLADNCQLASDVINLKELLKIREGKNSTAVQSNGDTLTQINQELLANLSEQRRKDVELELKVKCLEEKLSAAEKALESSYTMVNSLTEENQKLKKTVDELVGEKETLQVQQQSFYSGLLAKQLDQEKEHVRQLKFALHDKGEELEGLQKQLKEEKNQSHRKSEMISSLKKIMGNKEPGEIRNGNERSSSIKILKMEKEHLTKQLDARLVEIQKLEQKLTSLENSNQEQLNKEGNEDVEIEELNQQQMIEAVNSIVSGNGCQNFSVGSNDLSLHYEDIISDDDLPCTPKPDDKAEHQPLPNETSSQIPADMNQTPIVDSTTVEELPGASNQCLIVMADMDDLDLL